MEGKLSVAIPKDEVVQACKASLVCVAQKRCMDIIRSDDIASGLKSLNRERNGFTIPLVESPRN